MGYRYLGPKLTEAPLNKKVRDSSVVIRDALCLESFDIKNVDKASVVNTDNDNRSKVGPFRGGERKVDGGVDV